MPAWPSGKFGVCGVAAARWRKGGFASGWLPGRQSSSETMSQPSVFTAISAYSLAGVAGVGIVATAAGRTLLPQNAPWKDRVFFVWLVRGGQTTPFHPDPFFSWASLTTRTLFFDCMTINAQQPPKTRKKNPILKIKNGNMKFRRLTRLSTLSSRAPSWPCRPSAEQ